MKTIIPVLLALLGWSVVLPAQTRDILWLDGPSVSSSQWTNFTRYAEQVRAYDFNEVSDEGYFGNKSSNTISFWATSFNDRLTQENRTNVLGIGHDLGGLILRYMDQQQSSNTNLSAMILVGTPNQGGRIYEKLIPRAPDQSSETQRLINRLLDLRTAVDGCTDCNTVVATERWISSFTGEEASAYYTQAYPTSTTVTNLSAPRIPTAVIWGNIDQEDALTLSRTVGSYYDAALFGDDAAYLECYQEEILKLYEKLNQDKQITALRAIPNIASDLGKIKASSPFSIVGAIGDAINSALDYIEEVFEFDAREKEILECELIHQAMNAHWNLAVAPYEELETEIVIENCFSCDICTLDNFPTRSGLAQCLQECVRDCEDGQIVVEEITYFGYQPHDGLYTRDEQQLAGADVTYEAKKVNHFQEQFWEYPAIDQAFTELFRGDAGGAFVVPR